MMNVVLRGECVAERKEASGVVFRGRESIAAEGADRVPHPKDRSEGGGRPGGLCTRRAKGWQQTRRSSLERVAAPPEDLQPGADAGPPAGPPPIGPPRVRGAAAWNESRRRVADEPFADRIEHAAEGCLAKGAVELKGSPRCDPNAGQTLPCE